jgi:hypothetical protein
LRFGQFLVASGHLEDYAARKAHISRGTSASFDIRIA